MDVECGGCGEEVGEAQFLVQSIGGSFKTRKLVYSTSMLVGEVYRNALSCTPNSHPQAIQLGSRVRPLA